MAIPIEKEIQEILQDYNTLAEVYRAHSNKLPTQRETQLADLAFSRILTKSLLLAETRASEITPELDSLTDKACSNANTQQVKARDWQITQKYHQYFQGY